MKKIRLHTKLHYATVGVLAVSNLTIAALAVLLAGPMLGGGLGYFAMVDEMSKIARVSPSRAAATYPNFLTFVASYPIGGCSTITQPGFVQDCSNPGEFNCPEQLDWHNGNLLIGDSDNFWIQEITTDGQPIAQMGQGNQVGASECFGGTPPPNHLCGPHDAAYSSMNNSIIAADTYFQRIQKYDATTYTWQGAWDLWRDHPTYGRVGHGPEGIAFNSQGELFINTAGYATLNDSGYLVKYDLNNPGLDIESYPHVQSPGLMSLAIDSQDRVFVYGQEYDRNLQLLSPLFHNGTSPEEQLFTYRGSAFDSRDNLYIADERGILKIYSRTGTLLSYLDERPQTPYAWYTNFYGMAVNNNGEVFVSNCGNRYQLNLPPENRISGEIIKYQACFDTNGDGKGLYCLAGPDCNGTDYFNDSRCGGGQRPPINKPSPQPPINSKLQPKTLQLNYSNTVQ